MFRPKICFYCEKVCTDYVSSGGDYALRHFCVCRSCSEKQSVRRAVEYNCFRPYDSYGAVLGILNKFRSCALFYGIDTTDHPDHVWSLDEYIDMIRDLAYDYMYSEREVIPEDPAFAHAREAFYFALDRVRKNETGEYEQISIPLPPLGARIKDRDPS